MGCGREATIRQLVIGGVNKDWPVPKRVRSYMTLQYKCQHLCSSTRQRTTVYMPHSCSPWGCTTALCRMHAAVDTNPAQLTACTPACRLTPTWRVCLRASTLKTSDTPVPSLAACLH